jgi:hypothetical protein
MAWAFMESIEALAADTLGTIALVSMLYGRTFRSQVHRAIFANQVDRETLFVYILGLSYVL